MGTLTLQQFRAELLFDLRGRTDTSDPNGLSDTRLSMWVNAGYLHITHPSVFRHRELQGNYALGLISGQQAYTFTPIGGVTVTALRYVSHVESVDGGDFTVGRTKLFPRDEQWFQDRSRLTSGAPRDYFVRGSQILLNPIPGGGEVGQVLSLGVWREPVILVDGGRSELSTLWDEIILLASRWRAELHLGYRDLAEATKIDFTSLINEYRNFEDLHAEDWSWSAEVRHESAMESSP